MPKVVALHKIIPKIVVVVISSLQDTKKFIVVTAEHVDLAIKNDNRVSAVLAQLDYKLVLHIKLYLHQREGTVRERDVDVFHLVFKKKTFLDGFGEARKQDI